MMNRSGYGSFYSALCIPHSSLFFRDDLVADIPFFQEMT
jgi:hypothetical protein